MLNLPTYRLTSGGQPLEAHAWDRGQSEVLNSSERVKLVLGGPGTGKTSLLVEQVARRVEDGVPLEKILVLTNSRGAAQQLRASIVRRIGGAHLAPRVTTMHGFCSALMSGFCTPEAPMPRLLTAPEQEFRLRELLKGHDLSKWPGEVIGAARTRLFATQLRAALAKVRQLGLDPEDLQSRFGQDPVWVSVGELFEEYLTVLDFEGVIDYPELVHRSRLLLIGDDVRVSIKSTLSDVFCDEFSELDEAQLMLLGDLGDLGLGLVAFADPQQSIFRFRGAADSSVRWFKARFGSDRVFPLQMNHRGGVQLCSAWHSIAKRLSAHDAPLASKPTTGVDQVRAVVYDDVETEIGQLCAQLRSAHMREGVPWAECAVVTRTARRELAPLARALRQVGIPVEIAGDEIALSEQSAVRQLLFGVQIVLDGKTDPERVYALLNGPMGGLDPIRVRSLAKALRGVDAQRDSGVVQASNRLLAELLDSPESALGEIEQAMPVIELGRVLGEARKRVAENASVHEILWVIWSGTKWPERLRRAAILDADLRANNDLDAICELFEMASAADLSGERGLKVFLSEVSGQIIPADTGRESDLRGRGVRLLTAHRVKGEQFRRVFIIGAREGNWPKLVRRGSLLEADVLSAEGLVPLDPRAQIADERRLFYVACTRATEQLTVSGARSSAGEECQPSRFIHELGVEIEEVSGQPHQVMTLETLAAELRRTATDTELEPGLRRAAASRLARIAAQTNSKGVPLVPAADPRRWWGMTEPLEISGAESEIRFVGTDLADILECPRRWFLKRKMRSAPPSGAAATLGSVVHLMAQHSVTKEFDGEDLDEQLNRIWDRIPFEAPWLSDSEREEARAALERLIAWQSINEQRRVLGTEIPFEVRIDVSEVPITLAGSVDRLEIDDEGRLRIIDFKTSRNLPRAADVASHEQLGLYQLAASSGAFDSLAPGVRKTSGAVLVYARSHSGASAQPKTFTQQSLDEMPHLDDDDKAYPTWVHRKLDQARKLAQAPVFPAVQCPSCRFCAFQRGCPVRASGAEVIG